MSIWAKVFVAAVVGGFLGFSLGHGVQTKLIFSVYFADNITREFMLSGIICFWLGAFTAAALVLWRKHFLKFAAWLCLSGSVLGLIWLSTDSDSHFYRWWNSFQKPIHQQQFSYWNPTKNPVREYLGEALIFNCVPWLWAILLFWCGLKMMRSRPRAISQR